MGRGRLYQKPPGTTLDNRADQRRVALDKWKALIARMTQANAERSATPPPPAAATPPHQHRNVDRYMGAIAAQPFHELGLSDLAEVTPAYARLVRSATEVANDGMAQVVMPWPPVHVFPSAIAGLLTIASIGSAEPDQILVQGVPEAGRRASDPVRALVFPYARSTHAQARQVPVDRHMFGAVNFEHLKRYLNGNGEAAKDYHQVMARVRNLTGRASDGRDYAEFEHPILDEVVPHGLPRGERSSNSVLLWRTRSKTDIARQHRPGEADDPSKARFFLYTLRTCERLDVALRSIKPGPDLVILDLTRTARNRLGWHWVESAREFLACLREVRPATGVLAIADDPWTYRAARFDILGVMRPGRNGNVTPASGHAVHSDVADIVSPASAVTPSFDGGTDINVDGFFGDVDWSIEALRQLANSRTEKGDAAGTMKVRKLIATVRRTASLPGSLAELSSFLESETSTAAADDLLAVYRITADLAALADPSSLAGQVDAKTGSLDAARKLMRFFDSATPMTTLLETALQPALRSSSKSVVVFRSDLMAEFAAVRLAAVFPKLARRMESEFVRLGGERILRAIADLPPAQPVQAGRRGCADPDGGPHHTDPGMASRERRSQRLTVQPLMTHAPAHCWRGYLLPPRKPKRSSDTRVKFYRAPL